MKKKKRPRAEHRGLHLSDTSCEPLKESVLGAAAWEPRLCTPVLHPSSGNAVISSSRVSFKCFIDGQKRKFQEHLKDHQITLKRAWADRENIPTWRFCNYRRRKIKKYENIISHTLECLLGAGHGLSALSSSVNALNSVVTWALLWSSFIIHCPRLSGKSGNRVSFPLIPSSNFLTTASTPQVPLISFNYYVAGRPSVPDSKIETK